MAPVDPLTATTAVTTAVGVASVGLLKAAIDRLTKGLTEKARDAWLALKSFDIEQEYRIRVIRELGQTRVLGKSQSIDIDQIYTDVRVITRPAFEIHYQDSTIGDQALEKLRRLEAGGRRRIDEFLDGEPRLFVLGTPGAGKTTLMRHIAMKAARGSLPRLPVFVPLRDLVYEKRSLREYMDRILSIGGIPDPHLLLDQMLTNGEVILLFDGLDELPRGEMLRDTVFKEVIDLSREFPKTQIIISCRTAANDRSLERFKYVFVAEFDDSQQNHFIGRWFGDSKENHQHFLQVWEEPQSKGLRDLASSPLLLTLLCLAFQSTGAFPRKKIDLFQDAIDALIYHWDTDRGIVREGRLSSLEARRKDHLLQSLAFHTFLHAQYAFEERDGVKEIERYFLTLPQNYEPRPVADRTVLRELAANHGVIVERAIRLYSFCHLSIHEYLASRFLSESADESELSQALTGANIADPRWREVLVTLVIMKADASSLFVSMYTALRTHACAGTNLNSILAALKPISEKHVILGDVAKSIGFDVTRKNLRRKTRTEESLAENIHDSLEKLSAILRHNGIATTHPTQRRVEILGHLTKHYTSEMYERLDQQGVLNLLELVRGSIFLIECLRSASLKRPVTQLLEHILL